MNLIALKAKIQRNAWDTSRKKQQLKEPVLTVILIIFSIASFVILFGTLAVISKRVAIAELANSDILSDTHKLKNSMNDLFHEMKVLDAQMNELSKSMKDPAKYEKTLLDTVETLQEAMNKNTIHVEAKKGRWRPKKQ